jgi:hypothetical protein
LKTIKESKFKKTSYRLFYASALSLSAIGLAQAVNNQQESGRANNPFEVATHSSNHNNGMDNFEATKNKKQKSKSVKGIAVTGFNRLYGEPITSLGWFGDYGYDTIAVYNSQGQTPTKLTEHSSANDLVATILDPNFLQSHGLKSLSEVPTELINVPLRDVGMNGGFDGISYLSRPSELEHQPYQPFSPSQAFHTGDITVDDWMSAKGKLNISCEKNGTATVRMKLTNLIPHRLYSAWGFFNSDEQMPFANFGPVRPFAGLPNMIVSDDHGKGDLKRVLNFCPMDLKDGEFPLGAVFVNYHSDVEMHGGVLSFTEFDRYPGTVTHTQLFFPISE